MNAFFAFVWFVVVVLCIALGGLAAAAITFVFDVYFGFQSQIIFTVAIILCCYGAMSLAIFIMEKVVKPLFNLK